MDRAGDLGFGGTALTAQRTPRLSRKQKAAIIVRLMLKEGAQLSLDELPETLQIELTHEMGAMRTIDRATLRAVVDEFIADVNELGVSFPGGLAGALDMLEGALPPDTLRRVRRESGMTVRGDPWKIISGLETEALVEVARRESVEIAAVMLSKLPVGRAAEVLGKLPGDTARQITYAVSTTGAVDPETVRMIGNTIAGQLDARSPRAFDDAPVARLGAILNSSTAITRDDVLSGLDETDAVLADEVRREIFTFANIPQRIDPRDMPKVTRAVDPGVLTRALAAAESACPESAEFILSNMSQRMAAQLRDEIGELDPIKPKEGEEAMAEVVGAIRDMEAAGELLLVQGDE